MLHQCWYVVYAQWTDGDAKDFDMKVICVHDVCDMEIDKS